MSGVQINPHSVAGRQRLSDDQARCWQLVCDWLGGEHHAPDRLSLYGKGIRVVLDSGRLASWDFNYLTTLVFLAHDRCIRVQLEPAGPVRMALVLHQRHERVGDMMVRHPSLDEAVAAHRVRFPQPDQGARP